MASINWPSTLPLPLQEGYKELPPNTSIRTQMDSGPVKVRRRYTAGVRSYNFSMDLTLDEIGALDTFYVDTTRSGTLLFNWTDPRTSASVEARFIKEPEYTSMSNDGRVYIQLEVLP